jgi:dTDP-4-dehydrorhamnose 3,5-epimerase
MSGPSGSLTLGPASGPLAAELALPECGKGIGTVIAAADSGDLIAGVRVEPVALWTDDRGYFVEVARLGTGLTSAYPLATTQMSCSVSYPGTIKAFHYHQLQTDCWEPVTGMLQAVLVDLRKKSPTFGWRNTIYIGALRPWRLLIPPGIAHGYKVVGVEPAVLVYVTNRFYDPGDEGRLPYNEPGINYDWELQHK